MSGRSYLSIGDVLTLLREEFPDVTISKIRFLESQGLVNPERSPSGYRKFFDHDVERLRWVLRQQREHFLPLKVIRDRLADGELDDVPPDRVNGKSSEPAHAGAHAAHAAQGAPTDERPTKADEEAMARILADASRRSAQLPESAQARRGLQVVGEGAPADAPPSSTPAAAATPAVSAAPGPQRGSGAAASGASVQAAARPAEGASRGGKAPAHAAPEPAPRPAATPRSAATPAAAPTDTRAATGRAGGEGGSSAATPPAAGDPAGLGGMVTGASLTAEELCTASGLSPDELAGLEGFGLICPVRVAGMATYDEEALTVANLAAAFRSFGIEPRHLRLYRNAADREVGLIEQIVIPLLRQRNPESRQRAIDGADQLATLGQSMRASLLRQALRQHLGG